MEKLHLFWGDTHQNTYTPSQVPSMQETLNFARTYLDFYSGAYYTPISSPVPILSEYQSVVLPEVSGHVTEKSVNSSDSWLGIRAERIKDQTTLERDWKEFQEATISHHTPGEFITFPGYEWQGNGNWGDLNVIYKQEGYPIITAMNLPDLYNRLRKMPALAIPHHTAYHPGIRAPKWQNTDDKISPFAEIYSIHGCSETDEEWVGLRQNSHMGPAMGAGTYQNALDQGLHLGAICSTDNWSQMPGRWGHGLMGCFAENLTRDSLWDAFTNRRVYGVTGDRISLEFTCNEAPMGSILPYTKERNISIKVQCLDALDRLEILRNGRVIATHNHQGSWKLPQAGHTSRYITRIEAGWGPRPGDLPFISRNWQGEMHLSSGRFLNWWPCWTTNGQTTPKLSGQDATFSLQSYQHSVINPAQEAIVVEYETEPDAILTLTLNGKTYQQPVNTLMQSSHIMWYREECLSLIEQMTGKDPAQFQRQDPLFYHYAFKAKIHRTIPKVGYATEFSFVDSEPLTQETHYRVRVEQRNGQRAWSSPIWVKSE